MIKSLYLGAVFMSACLFTMQTLAEDQVKVGVFYADSATAAGKALAQAVKHHADLGGMQVISFDAKGQAKTQLRQLRAHLKQNKDPILISAADPKQADKLIKAAKSAGVPIIFMDRDVTLAQIKSYENAFMVGADDHDAGMYAAAVFKAYLSDHPEADKNHNQKLDYIRLEDVKHLPNSKQRMEALLGTLKQYGYVLNELKALKADGSGAKAGHLLSDYALKHDLSEVEAIVSSNDAMALGALKTLQQHGYNLPSGKGKGFIPVNGIDALNPAVAAVKNGTLIGTAINDYSAIAGSALKIANCYAHDINVEPSILGFAIDQRRITIPYTIITNEKILK